MRPSASVCPGQRLPLSPWSQAHSRWISPSPNPFLPPSLTRRADTRRGPSSRLIRCRLSLYSQVCDFSPCRLCVALCKSFVTVSPDVCCHGYSSSGPASAVIVTPSPLNTDGHSSAGMVIASSSLPCVSFILFLSYTVNNWVEHHAEECLLNLFLEFWIKNKVELSKKKSSTRLFLCAMIKMKKHISVKLKMSLPVITGLRHTGHSCEVPLSISHFNFLF